MHGWGPVAIAAVIGIYATFSGGLGRRWISAALFFVVVGLALDDTVTGLLPGASTEEALRVAAEATLVLVLFTDASRLDVVRLRREYSLPGRLLGVGLPLTIAAGALLGAVLIGGLSPLEALVLAIALAPTDAALGQQVVTDERVPVRVRQGLNVESGLNDGICVPLLLIALAIAGAEEGLTSASDAVHLVVEEIGWGIVGGGLAGLLGGLAMRPQVGGRFAESAWMQVVPLASAAVAYGVAVELGGSGFIGAFVGGMVFGGLRSSEADQLTRFTEEIGGVFDAVTFMLFGAGALALTLGRAGPELYLYAVLSLTVVRMVPVALAMLGTGAGRPTVGYLGWFGPRGLASIVFAVIIIQEGNLAGARTLVDAITITVGLSVLLHGLSALPLTNRYVRWYAGHRTPPEMEAVPAVPIRWRHHHAVGTHFAGVERPPKDGEGA